MQGIKNCQNANEEDQVLEGLTPHAQEQGVGSGNSIMDDWDPGERNMGTTYMYGLHSLGTYDLGWQSPRGTPQSQQLSSFIK